MEERFENVRDWEIHVAGRNALVALMLRKIMNSKTFIVFILSFLWNSS
jgi:hypothetical protein